MPDFVRPALVIVYFALVLGMAAFAFHKVKMLALLLRQRRRSTPPLPAPGASDAHVCVQCPVYNEALVIDELLASVAALRWPEGRCEIQILDDSTDATTARIAAWLAAHPEEARRMVHVRRPARSGYKAGALAHGMTLSRAEYFAIFDADFRPRPDFLETLMPHFTDAPEVGLVQARWDFANRDASLLTRFQGLFLDAHFLVEQPARHAAGLFFNFNGTAGIWRRRALEEAGGWSADTVTEDLDASYRAQLRGWRFVYRGDYAVPSELPENVTAFKSQQRRWTKGGIQVMRKQLAGVLRDPRVSGRVKREAAWHLLVGFIHPLLITFAALLVPYFLWAGTPADGLLSWAQPVLLIFTLWATVGLYLAGRSLRGGHWLDSLLIFLGAPLVLSFGLAMSLTNSFAVLEGLLQKGGEFVRTPKGGAASALNGVLDHLRSRGFYSAIVAGEACFGALLAAGAWHFFQLGQPAIGLLLGSKALGFLALAGLSLLDLRPSRA